MLPVAPYCVQGDVYFFIKTQIAPAQAISTRTSPDTDEVAAAIRFSASQIDSRLRQAGYQVPLLPLSGESWPDDQSTYLNLINALGAAAISAGYMGKPIMASRSSKESEGSVSLYKLFLDELNRIYSHTPTHGEVAKSRLRAFCYPGTPAQRALAVPQGPMTDAGAALDRTRTFHLPALADLIFQTSQRLVIAANWYDEFLKNKVTLYP